MGGLRTKLLVLLLSGVVWVWLGWWLIASAADWFVLNTVRPRYRYYTAFQYTDYVWFYVIFSSICLSLFAGVRFWLNEKWVWPATSLLVVLFSVFVFIAIEDDLKCGRPFGPEIFFALAILVFNILTFFIGIACLRRLSRGQVAQQFR